MDQFEEAKLRSQKRVERQAKYAAPQAVETSKEGAQVSPSPAVAAEVPKENSTAAIIVVTVTLPDKTFSFSLSKAGVYQNANKSKLNANEFQNRIREGLKPLLGDLTG
jgi:hypothetical protein